MMYVRKKSTPDVESLGATDVKLGQSPAQDLLTPERSYGAIMEEWSVREAVGGMFRDMKAAQQEELDIFLKEIPFLSDEQLLILKKAVDKSTKSRGI